MAYDPNNSDHVALVDDVLYRIDQVGAAGQVEPLNRESVWKQLKKAARHILRYSPWQIALFSASSHSAGVSAKDGGSLLTLPSDFLRLLRIESSDWERAVTELLSDKDPLYYVQGNPNSRVDGTRPIAVLVANPGSAPNQGLHVYPSVTAASVLYVPDVEPDAISEDLEDAMIWEAAGRVLDATNEPDWADRAYGMVDRVLSRLKVGLEGEPTNSA